MTIFLRGLSMLPSLDGENNLSHGEFGPMMMSAAEYITLLSAPSDDDVPGWFNPTDALLLCAIDEIQDRCGITGDVLEIGVYQGKSAILLGFFPRAAERLVVCDIFDDVDAVGTDNSSESTAYYDGLNRAGFEQNYLRFHRELPVVHARPSAELGELVPAGSCRLVHVDGSHQYDAVCTDIATARRLLGPGGVVVFDDWSSSHVPGVAMAFWEEYAKGELAPLAFTRGKFYATWDVSGITCAEVDGWVSTRDELESRTGQALGRYRAGYVTMAPEFWRTYSAGLFGNSRGKSVAMFAGF